MTGIERPVYAVGTPFGLPWKDEGEIPIENGVYLSDEIKLSDHCLVDHLVRSPNPDAPRERFWPGKLLAIPYYLLIDRKMHFTGLRGGIWRLLGVDRSPKNPNICNV